MSDAGRNRAGKASGRAAPQGATAARWAVALLLSGLGVLLGPGAARALEFPGPRVHDLPDKGLSITAVRQPGRVTDDLVVGADSGSLRLLRYSDASASFTILARVLLEGRVVAVVPWEGLPLQERGVVVATADPDRVAFVSVLPNLPYLTLQQTVPLPEDPGALAFVGDVLGGDGRIAVSLPGIDEVAFLAEDGNWRLDARLPAGDRPRALVGLDVDGDQVREAVAANGGYLSGDFGVYRLDENGEWALELTAIPGLAPVDLAVRDLDGDGADEIVALDRDTAAATVLGGSPGGLVERGRIALTLAADGLEFVSLQDGSPALVTRDASRGLAEMYLPQNGGWVRQDSYFAGCRSAAAHGADLNGDGRPELVSLSADAPVLTVMVGHSGPGFWGFPALALSGNPGASGRGDFDGDGYADLLVAGGDAESLTLFRGRFNGALSSLGADFDLGYLPGRMATGDLDGDGRAEAVVADVFRGALATLRVDQVNGPVEVARTVVGFFPTDLRIEDLDGDGRPDLMALAQGYRGVVVLYGAGDGGFGQRVDVAVSAEVKRVIAVDVNGDGRRDMVTSDGSNRIWISLASAARAFVPGAWLNAGSGAFDLAAGDLDLDGDLDVVVANRTEHSLSFFENSGAGLVRRIGGHALNGAPSGLALADFNLDGRVDVLVPLAEDALLSLVLGTANWTYGVGQDFPGTPAMTGVEVADLNVDGVPDILTLDRDLLLGLSLLNLEQTLVSVAPDALRADCVAGGWRITVRPDRPGPWRLETSDGATLLADGVAWRGDLETDGGDWLLHLTARDLAAAGGGGGGAAFVRLVMGAPATETATLALPDCGGAVRALPRPAVWERQPWPNPCNPRMQAAFVLDRPSPARVAVYDLAGREVAVLLEGELEAGRHEVAWRGEGRDGPAAAGVYLLRIVTGDGVLASKIALVK